MKQGKSKTMKIIKRTILILLMAGAILTAVCIFIFGKMVNDGVLYQNKNNDTKKNSIKQLEEWGYDRDAFHDKYQGIDFSIESKDGNIVPGNIFLSGEDQPWVILVHGAGGDHEFAIAYVEMFLELNYNVLTYDQRGHGDNSDKRVTFGIFEKHDIESLVEYIKEEYHARSIMIHGQSMGGATAALYAASEHGKENLDACILDSPVPGMELLLSEMFVEDGMSDDMAKTVIWCGEIYSGLFSHLDYKEGDTIEKAKNIEVPTMVIVSKQDSVCLPEQVSGVYENIPAKNKKMAEFDCEHIKGIFEYQEQYYQEIADFLQSVK